MRVVMASTKLGNFMFRSKSTLELCCYSFMLEVRRVYETTSAFPRFSSNSINKSNKNVFVAPGIQWVEYWEIYPPNIPPISPSKSPGYASKYPSKYPPRYLPISGKYPPNILLISSQHPSNISPNIPPISLQFGNQLWKLILQF